MILGKAPFPSYRLNSRADWSLRLDALGGNQSIIIKKKNQRSNERLRPEGAWHFYKYIFPKKLRKKHSEKQIYPCVYSQEITDCERILFSFAAMN